MPSADADAYLFHSLCYAAVWEPGRESLSIMPFARTDVGNYLGDRQAKHDTLHADAHQVDTHSGEQTELSGWRGQHVEATICVRWPLPPRAGVKAELVARSEV